MRAVAARRCLGLALALMLAASCQAEAEKATGTGSSASSPSDVPATVRRAPETAPSPRAQEVARTKAPDTVEVEPTVEAPSTPLAQERPVLRVMREQIAPRFGRPEQRVELVEALTQLPALAPEALRPAWTRIVAGITSEGSLAPVCKACHVEQRLPYLGAIGAHPLVERLAGANGETP